MDETIIIIKMLTGVPAELAKWYTFYRKEGDLIVCGVHQCGFI